MLHSNTSQRQGQMPLYLIREAYQLQGTNVDARRVREKRKGRSEAQPCAAHPHHGDGDAALRAGLSVEAPVGHSAVVVKLFCKTCIN